MRKTMKLLSVTALVGSLAAVAMPAGAADMIGEGVTVYMQMGGQPGEPPVLPRTNGANNNSVAAFDWPPMMRFSWSFS